MKIDIKKIKRLHLMETQKEFAKKAGINEKSYSLILCRGTCSRDSLLKIAKALDVDPEELIRTEA